MKRSLFLMAGLGLFLPFGSSLQAQERQRVSPHETIAATIGGKKITIEYGRPYKKGRKIFGELVPFGKVWRTGADEATIFTTEGDLMLGSFHIPAGSYSLFTVPGEKEWALVLNKTAKQWGAYNYDEKQDLGRVKMTVQAVAAAEQLTIAIEPQGGNKGVLKIKWDTVEASVPIMMH